MNELPDDLRSELMRQKNEAFMTHSRDLVALIREGLKSERYLSVELDEEESLPKKEKLIIEA